MYLFILVWMHGYLFYSLDYHPVPSLCFFAHKGVFNFLEFVLLSHIVVCAAQCMFPHLLGLSFLHKFTLSSFKPLDSVLLFWLACKVIFIVEFLCLYRGKRSCDTKLLVSRLVKLPEKLRLKFMRMCNQGQEKTSRQEIKIVFFSSFVPDFG